MQFVRHQTVEHCVVRWLRPCNVHARHSELARSAKIAIQSEMAATIGANIRLASRVESNASECIITHCNWLLSSASQDSQTN